MFARNRDFISDASSAFCLATASSRSCATNSSFCASNSCWDCVSSSVCSSSWRACTCVCSRSSRVRTLRARISRLMAMMGSSSSTSAVSFAAGVRNPASSMTPRPSCDTSGQATTDDGAADPSPEEMPRYRGGRSAKRRVWRSCAHCPTKPSPSANVRRASVLSLRAVARDQRQALHGGVKHVEPGRAAAERRHQAREHALSQLGKCCRALKLGRNPRGVRLYPPLLLHGGGFALENVDGSRKRARRAGRANERYRLAVIPLRDEFHGSLQRAEW